MPEGHTIHRYAKHHRRLLAGQRLRVSSPQGRFIEGAALLDGAVLDEVEPLGKHLFYRFSNGCVAHVHLGMHGRFRMQDVVDGTPPEARGQVRMRLLGERKVVDLSGPTVCEVLDETRYALAKAKLGPDVLDPRADVEKVWQRISRSRGPIAVLLMDQTILSGVGNAYRAEILYRQKLHPLVPGKELTREQFDALWRDTVHLLQVGVKVGHIVCVEPADVGRKSARDMKADERFYVYRRERCRVCDAKVVRTELNGRTCFHCPKEQRLRPTRRRSAA